MNREELAWAAGFFDGEGSTGFRRQHKRAGQMRLSISQVDRRSLDRFRAAVGEIGSVLGPYHKRYGANGVRSIYDFSTASFEKVQAIVALLWTWLGAAKREQAREVLLAFRAIEQERQTRCRRGHLYTGQTRPGIHRPINICVECRAEAGRRHRLRRSAG